MYQQVLLTMTQYFRVILIDCLGCGASTRPKMFDFQRMSAKDVIDFFVKYFEAWRAEMKITGFYLAG